MLLFHSNIITPNPPHPKTMSININNPLTLWVAGPTLRFGMQLSCNFGIATTTTQQLYLCKVMTLKVEPYKTKMSNPIQPPITHGPWVFL